MKDHTDVAMMHLKKASQDKTAAAVLAANAECVCIKQLKLFMKKAHRATVEGTLPKMRARVLVTVLGPAKPSKQPARFSGLLRNKGILKYLKEDPVKIQRRIRDEW
jgi:hypothetical protein